jgi:hypothetical protein
MKVEILLADGVNLAYDEVSRIYERDERCLYVYGVHNDVVAVVQKEQVLRLTTLPVQPENGQA